MPALYTIDTSDLLSYAPRAFRAIKIDIVLLGVSCALHTCICFDKCISSEHVMDTVPLGGSQDTNIFTVRCLRVKNIS